MPSSCRTRRISILFLTFLAIEFLDELVYGAGEAAWPLIRDELMLSYIQIGVLLSLPKIISSLIEPFIGILGDTSLRRRLILSGGVIFTLSLVLTATSQSYIPLLVSFILFNPASGAFVSLSQASLMDANPARREHNMARWTFAGALGVFAGPLLLGGFLIVGATWRVVYGFAAVLAAMLWLVAVRLRIRAPGLTQSNTPVKVNIPKELITGIRASLSALKHKEVLRWLLLLEFSDFMLDVLYSYLALYFVDIAKRTPIEAGVAVAVWSGAGLIGDFLLIPLLERIKGLDYLRVSTIIELMLFPAFLLVESFGFKLILVGLLGVFNAGWYSILMAKLYESMPGQSGKTITVNNLAGIVGSLVPFLLGVVAETFGLGVSMWLLIAGPVALMVGLPRKTRPPS